MSRDLLLQQLLSSCRHEFSDAGSGRRGHLLIHAGVAILFLICSEMDVTVQDEDLEITNFDSVNRVVAFVVRKQESA